MTIKKQFFGAKLATIRRSSRHYLDELTANAQLPQAQVLALQRRRAADLARFAAEHSPFYREHFAAAGVDLSRLEDPEQWQRLPIITRQLVKANNDRFASDEADETTAREAETSGSTGEPLVVQHDARVPTLSLAWRMYRSWGVEPWDNMARISRWTFDRISAIKNAVAWWPSRQIFMDTRMMDDDSMRAFHQQIVATKPRLIEGYLGAVTEFAYFLERTGLKIPAPVAVGTTAAPLPMSVRRRLEAAYGAPVYDEYRSSEVGWIAGECREQNGLHIFADARLIEIVDDDGNPVPNGTQGIILMTDLTNRVFPMIRYQMGDRGTLRDGLCPCGSTLPLMEGVDGRTDGVIRLPSGRVLAQQLTSIFAEHPTAVQQFQLHQLDDYSIHLRVVLTDDPHAVEAVEEVAETFYQRVDREVPVIIDYLDEQPYSGGKIDYILSDVPVPG